VRNSGVTKIALPLRALVMLSVLAGAFIAFGAAFFTLAMTGADAGYGPARVLGGVAFSLGLILVIVGGTGGVALAYGFAFRRQAGG
jgi:formate/nitrite transporter FocA (FNT family)